MYLSRRGCPLREDGLSKLGLRSTTQCRRISIFPMAQRYLRDTCSKLSWESMSLEKKCHEAFSLLASMWGIWTKLVKPSYHCEFRLTLAKEVLIEKGNIFFYPPAQLSSLELWSGWFEKNNLTFTWNHCLPDATFGTFIQSLDSFLPNSVSRVKTDSLLAKGVCVCISFGSAWDLTSFSGMFPLRLNFPSLLLL